MSSELFDFLINDLQSKKAAFLDYSQKERPVQGHRVVVNLNDDVFENAPRAVNFPFKSVFVSKATDADAELFLRPITKDDSQPPISFKARDAWGIDYQVPRCYLHWVKQPGKTIELLFFADSEFRSGSQISVNAGGVSINDGTTITTPSSLTIPTNTATIIAPVDINRKVMHILNDGHFPIMIGDNTITNLVGFPLMPGDTCVYRNTGALYGYTYDANNLLRFMKES